jgi:predicted amidophosphoribosyltransferase
MAFHKLFDNTLIDEEAINYLYDYQPKNRGQQDAYSEDILMIKNLPKKIPFSEEIKTRLKIMVATFIKYFHSRLPANNNEYVFCLVPSHNSATDNKNGIYYFGRWCSPIRANFDKDIFIRYRTIDSLHDGGTRDIVVHLNSLRVKKNVQGKCVVVIDDVTTTGNSLAACKALLLRAGCKKVILFSFSKTVSRH